MADSIWYLPKHSGECLGMKPQIEQESLWKWLITTEAVVGIGILAS